MDWLNTLILIYWDVCEYNFVLGFIVQLLIRQGELWILIKQVQNVCFCKVIGLVVATFIDNTS